MVGTCKLYKVLPTGSIGYVMKTVHSEEELAHVAKVAEAAPKEVALIERLGGAEGIAEVKAPTASKGSLSEYLKFGPKAVRTVALPASWGVSTMKTFRGFVGHLHDLLPAPVREAATGFFALCALLGVTNAVRHFRAAFAKTESHLTQTATPPVSA